MRLLILAAALLTCFSNPTYSEYINDYKELGTSENPKSRLIDSDGFGSCPDKNAKHPVYLPHSTDCNKFYICDNGKLHLKACLPGLHFNIKINACDYPENAGCIKGYSKEPKIGMINDDEVKMCPVKNSEHPIYLPHPDECNKFYVCDNGNSHIQVCQPGLHFNARLNVCDYPENAGCDKISDLGISEDPKGRVVEDGDFSSCPAKNFGQPVYLSHPSDCSKFYICNNGIPYLRTCQPGLHFNEKIKACDYPKNVGCIEEDTYKSPGFQSPFCPSVDGQFPIFYRHPANCSVFYLCGNGLAYEFVCPARLHFNLRKRVCDYENSANCRIS